MTSRSRRRAGSVVAAVAICGLVAFLLVRRGPARRDAPGGPVPATAALPAGTAPVHPVAQRSAVRVVTPPVADARSAAQGGSFEGRVVSALTGEGIAGAQLTFARPEETGSTASGADGAFRFEPRVAGRWLLAAATARGFLPFAPEWGQSPVSLVARPGEALRGLVVSLSPAEEYEGRVVDDDERPVAGAEVRVLGGGAGQATLVPLADRYRSDGAGRFRFTAPEDAVVEASLAGFATGRARVDYAVRVGHQLTVRLRRAAGAVLAIEGQVEAPSGAPAEGALVTAAAKARPGEAPASAHADARGRFTLTDLTPGAWIVTATRAGAASASAEAPAGATGLRLRLTAGGALAGRVQDRRSGAPVPAFTLVVQSARDSGSTSVVDPRGEYELDGLTPGPAVVTVVAPGYAPSPERRVVVPAPAAAPARADFELSSGGRLTGVVEERGNHAPLAGARVAVEGTGPSLGVPVRNETVTDAEGRFALTGLAERSESLVAAAAGHHARIVAVPSIPEGEQRGPITIALTPLAPGEDPRVELAGIGVGVEKRGEVLVITRVVPGGGAAEVGLAPGDEVRAIDGASVAGLTLSEAVPLLRGPEGTSVALAVVKGGAAGQEAVIVVVPRRLVRG